MTADGGGLRALRPGRLISAVMAATLVVAAGPSSGRAQVAPAKAGAPASRARAPSGRPAAAARGGRAAPDGSARPSRSLFRTSDLPYAGVGFGSVLLSEPLEGLERGIRSHTSADPSGFDAAFVDAGDVAGHALVDLGLSAGVWVGGKLAGSSRFERAGLHALETLVASDAVLLGEKVLLGRRRPYATSDPDEFKPLAFHEVDQSYASGHATRAFALAAVAVADFPDQKWLPWVAWPVAAATAASRLVGRQHWLTDVVSGAALGILSTRVVLRLDGARGDDARASERPGATLAPFAVGGGAGAVLDLPLP